MRPLESHSHTLLYRFLITVMTRTAADKAEKAEKPRNPEINWSEDKSSAV